MVTPLAILTFVKELGSAIGSLPFALIGHWMDLQNPVYKLGLTLI